MYIVTILYPQIGVSISLRIHFFIYSQIEPTSVSDIQYFERTHTHCVSRKHTGPLSSISSQFTRPPALNPRASSRKGPKNRRRWSDLPVGTMPFRGKLGTKHTRWCPETRALAEGETDFGGWRPCVSSFLGRVKGDIPKAAFGSWGQKLPRTWARNPMGHEDGLGCFPATLPSSTW